MSVRTIIAASLIAAAAFTSVQAAQPQGFEVGAAQQQSMMPQGFGNAALMTVKQVKDQAKDDDIVTMRGRFTAHVRGDNYVFMDEAGDSIEAELDDDMNWSHVVKDEPVEITAKVDKDLLSIELEVLRAKSIK